MKSNGHGQDDMSHATKNLEHSLASDVWGHMTIYGYNLWPDGHIWAYHMVV